MLCVCVSDWILVCISEFCTYLTYACCVIDALRAQTEMEAARKAAAASLESVQTQLQRQLDDERSQREAERTQATEAAMAAAKRIADLTAGAC